MSVEAHNLLVKIVDLLEQNQQIQEEQLEELRKLDRRAFWFSEVVRTRCAPVVDTEPKASVPEGAPRAPEKEIVAVVLSLQEVRSLMDLLMFSKTEIMNGCPGLIPHSVIFSEIDKMYRKLMNASKKSHD